MPYRQKLGGLNSSSVRQASAAPSILARSNDSTPRTHPMVIANSDRIRRAETNVFAIVLIYTTRGVEKSSTTDKG